jgi:hypothetical protein
MFLRYLQDESGKHVFTHQELSKVVGSQKRQASSGHVERFRECGSDFLHFLTRKRKVDLRVVAAVTQKLLHDPLAELGELQETVAYGFYELCGFEIDVSIKNLPKREKRHRLPN